MIKKLMTAMVCGGVAMAISAGCNKTETKVEPKADKTATKADAAAKAPAVKDVDPATVLVSVGTDKLTVGEADKQIKGMLGRNAGSITPEQMGAMMGRFRPQAAERFVMHSLLKQEVEKRKVVATDKDVDAALSMIKTNLPKDMTMEDVLKREGMTMAELRANITSELRIKTMVESEIPTNTVVTDEEVNKFYADQKDSFVQPETVEARHILIKTEPTDTDKVKAEKKAKIEALQKQLAGGADFAKLAKENSDCPSKERGGDLGSFPRGQMVKEFEEAAFTQKTNEVGPVVTTQFGYHIIQVTKHEAGKTTPLAEVKDKLVAHLKQQKQMELFQGFMKKLQGQYTVTYSDLAKPPAQEMPGMMPEMAE